MRGNFTEQHARKKTQACNFIKKETQAQWFSCEFYEISKNMFSYRTPPVAASESQNGDFVALQDK